MKHFKSISEFHRFRELPAPQHPLISVVNVAEVKHLHVEEPTALALGFYSIAVKRMSNVKVKYGQQPFDFNEGVMSFMAPNQVITIALDKKEEELKQSGWVLYIHPDFLWNTPMASAIKKYDFWSYDFHEALFLSEKEEATIIQHIQNILVECHSNIDQFTKKIILTQIESLLSYSERFYNRQFITREKSNHEVLGRLEQLLHDYFNSGDLIEKGLPTVQSIAESLNLSPKYLSNLLRVHTGQSTQQHIHDKLIEKAKEQLSTTNLSVSEIAYSLGFEHLQSFSKIFKAKTNVSPLAFRASFN